MPKERIATGSGFDVIIGWERDGSVQVGLEVEAGFPLIDRLYGDEDSLRAIGNAVAGLYGATDVELGRAILYAVKASNLSPGCVNGTSSIWSTVSRSQCNRLIRHLRRARDMAYGRDE